MGSILPRPDEPPQEARPERPLDDSIGRGSELGFCLKLRLSSHLQRFAHLPLRFPSLLNSGDLYQR